MYLWFVWLQPGYETTCKTVPMAVFTSLLLSTCQCCQLPSRLFCGGSFLFPHCLYIQKQMVYKTLKNVELTHSLPSQCVCLCKSLGLSILDYSFSFLVFYLFPYASWFLFLQSISFQGNPLMWHVYVFFHCIFYFIYTI